MNQVRPTGVKIVIAYLLFSLVYAVGYILLVLQMGLMQGSQYSNLLLPIVLPFMIVGLWWMKRWGLWLTITVTVLRFVSGFQNTATLINQLSYVMKMSIPSTEWNLLFLAILIISGPILIVTSFLITLYLYKVRQAFRSKNTASPPQSEFPA